LTSQIKNAIILIDANTKEKKWQTITDNQEPITFW